jgi:glycosyltransferase involved in cell wall biosynthesis
MIVTNSPSGGGAERAMNLVANELTSRGWPIALVPVNLGEPDLILPECEVFPLSRKWHGGLLGTITSILKFNKVVNAFDPTVIVLNCDLPELLGSLLLSKRTIVVLQHSSKPWDTRVALGRIIRRILKFRSSVWIAVSNHLEIWPFGSSPDAVLVNPLPPDEETLPPSNNKLKRILFVGRLSPEKCPGVAIEIALELGVDATVVGDGQLLNPLKESAERGQMRIHFAGWQKNPWSLFEDGDLLIIPSSYEGDGLIVIEALQMKIPFLLSNIPDFQRFELPPKNYCENLDDFVSRAREYSEKLDELVVPEVTSTRTLKQREIKTVGNEWEAFLNTLQNR